MVSYRCIMVVKRELEKLNINYGLIDLGIVEVQDDITENQRTRFEKNLATCGLELLDNKRQIFIERICCLILEMVRYNDEIPQENYSSYISKKLRYDYKYISNIFSEIKGITIQQFIIIHKIEKVKELLLYDELTLTEIAYKLHYSSVGHLSNQFKKTTGLSAKSFKNLKLMRNQIE